MFTTQHAVEVIVTARVAPRQFHSALLLLGHKVDNTVVVHELIDDIGSSLLLYQLHLQTVGTVLTEMQWRRAALHNQAEVVIHALARQLQRVLTFVDDGRVTRKVATLSSHNLSGIVLHVYIQQQFSTGIPDITALFVIDRPTSCHERNAKARGNWVVHRTRHIK